MKKYYYFIILFLCSCNASIYSFKSSYDKFDNYKKFELQANNLGKKNSFYIGSHDTYLNAQCFIMDSIIKYSLIVNYNASDWLFIEEGESLIMLIDGKRLGFSGKGSIDHRNTYSSPSVSIQEIAYYDITKQEFEQIVNGDKIEIKLSGSKYFEEYYFTKGNKEAFKKFYDAYVNKSPKEILSIPIKETKVGAVAYIISIVLVGGLTWLLLH